MQTSKDFLHIFLDMGDALLNSGAEIFRVEDTLNRMGYACGAAQIECFCDHIQHRYYHGISGRRSADTDPTDQGVRRK